MYDELVKAIRQNTCHFDACGMCPKGNALCVDRMALQAADAIEELATNYDAATDIMKHQTEYIEELSKPRWIPVTERLPEHSCGESNSVLTVSSLGAMRVLYFDGGNWCYPTGEALTTAGKFPITHWMPLPEPPEEES